MRLALALSLCLLLAASSASAQLVNGSFEPSSPVGSYLLLSGGSTAIPGWTVVNPRIEWLNPVAYLSFGLPAEGSYIIDLAASATGGGIEQTFPTIADETYVITFSLGTLRRLGRTGYCEITVEADAASQLFSTAHSASTIAWESKTFMFTADDASATLRFSTVMNDVTNFVLVDGVGAVPLSVANDEPSFGSVKVSFE